jgi:glycosyltransferase involved in cell wall biosynthesis
MRILISGVGYAPEVTGIGPYTTGLAEHLAAQGHEVIVATTFPFAPLWRWFELPPRWRTRQRLNGVEVWRTKIILPPRRTTAWRIVFDSSVGLITVLTALSISKVDVTICVSPPIQTALFASAARFKLGKLVINVQDLPTEAARSVGMLRGRSTLRVARVVEQMGYKLADHIVVISNVFATYLQALGIDNSRISDIPNWADLDSVGAGTANEEMRIRLGAYGQDFLVVYTGNMGAKQDLLNVVSAAALLKQQKHIKFALVGDGQERQKIADEVAARGLENVKLLPLQSAADFSTVLASGDALLINQAPMVVDSVLPSKLLTYMASGRPVLAAVHGDSTTAQLVREARCGVVAAPGRPDILAKQISEMAFGSDQKATMDEMGRRGRAHAERHFGRESVLRRWDDLLANLCSAFTSQ